MPQVEWKKFFAVAVVLLILGNVANSYFDRRDDRHLQPFWLREPYRRCG